MAHNYFLKDLKSREKEAVIRIENEKLDNERGRVANEFQEKKVLPQEISRIQSTFDLQNDNSTKGGGVCEVADLRAGV